MTTITQADRDAVAGFTCGFCPDDAEGYLAEAFARHRIEAEQRGRIEGARWALDAAAKVVMPTMNARGSFAMCVSSAVRALAPETIIKENTND